MNEREIRSLPVTLETRAEENGKRTIAGQVPYGIESEVLRDVFGDNFVEELAPRCFDESLKVRDVVALWSHVLAQVLGGTKNRTLRLTSNEERLLFDLDLPDTQAGRDAWESIRRGDVDGVSFGMVVKRDKWSVVKRDGQEVYKRTILEAELWEISPAVFAAYSASAVTCRSLEAHKERLQEDREMKDNESKKRSRLEETVAELENELRDLDSVAEDRTHDDNKEGVEMKEKTVETRTVPAVAISASGLEEREAFNHYLRTGEIRALTVSSETKGAALAPVDFAKEIIDGLADVAVMRQIARVLPPISGKSVAYPRRTGGTGAAMVLEGQPIAPYDLTFDQVIITPKKAAALVEVSNELLQDAGVDIAGYLAQHFIDEIGELLEDQYWNGDGVDANLLGILTAEDASEQPLIERVETAETTGVDVEDILTLWAELPSKYRRNAVFVCNSAMEAELRKMKDGNGQYLMVPDLTTGLGNTLLGRPLYLAEGFPGDLTAGDDVLMVGDFMRAVYIGDKIGIDIQRNESAGFYKDTVAFRAIFRTDIQLAWPDALRVLQIKSGAA
ncbi:phage major capsid protein [Candidatus Darwinibacter acetoxidans]